MARNFLRRQGNANPLDSNPANGRATDFDDPILKRKIVRREDCCGSDFGRNRREFSGLFTIPAQKFVIAVIDSSRSHP